jgi:AbrB family looped-hinge helix DNA binding protein
MRVRIDKAGRITLPKAVRERMGLSNGNKLKLEEDAGKIILRPIAEESLWRREDGHLVFYGHLGEVNWDRLIDNMREEQILEILRSATGNPEVALEEPKDTSD